MNTCQVLVVFLIISSLIGIVFWILYDMIKARFNNDMETYKYYRKELVEILILLLLWTIVFGLMFLFYPNLFEDYLLFEETWGGLKPI